MQQTVAIRAKRKQVSLDLNSLVTSSGSRGTATVNGYGSKAAHTQRIVSIAEVPRVERVFVGERTLELSYLHSELREFHPLEIVVPHMRRAVELSLELVVHIFQNLSAHIETHETHTEAFASARTFCITCLEGGDGVASYFRRGLRSRNVGCADQNCRKQYGKSPFHQKPIKIRTA